MVVEDIRKVPVMEFNFSKVAGLQPAASPKMNSYTDISQNF